MLDKFKIQDFIKLIKVLEKLFIDNLGNNPELSEFLKKFKISLEAYKNYSGEEFLYLLESFHSNQKSELVRKNNLKQINLEEISFFELRNLLEKIHFTKEELLEIGEKKFGISKGANKRLNKEQIKELIESSMKNIETLDVIKKKASE